MHVDSVKITRGYNPVLLKSRIPTSKSKVIIAVVIILLRNKIGSNDYLRHQYPANGKR